MMRKIHTLRDAIRYADEWREAYRRLLLEFDRQALRLLEAENDIRTRENVGVN